MSWLPVLAKMVSPNFKSLAKNTNSIQLVTIGFSHYCEIATWCLKVKGIPYTEHSYPTVQHILPAIALRTGDKELRLSNTSRVTEVQVPNLSKEEIAKKQTKEKRRERAARSTAVPVAIAPNGTVWTDSWDIASKTGLPPIDPMLKKLLDERLGVLSRQLSFHYMLQPHNDIYFNKLLTIHTGYIWKFLWWLFLSKYTKNIMIKIMKPFHVEAVNECRVELYKAISEIDTIISNKKTKFLYSNEIGVSDIALASLMSVLVNPPQYCNSKYTSIFEELMQNDANLSEEVERIRNTITGKYVMELYSNHR